MHREAVVPPPHFDIDHDAWPPNRRRDAIEKRHQVVIDIEPARIVAYGNVASVKSALRELVGMFQEFWERNQTHSFHVSTRAAHRIGMWVFCQRLQNETKTAIAIEQNTATVTIRGPKALLPDAYQCVMAFARTVDAEKETHYLVPWSKDLRRLLVIQLPQLIAKAGGPEDEEEARQMFTVYVSHPIRSEESANDRACYVKARKMAVKLQKDTR
ncbi:hypothetical protein DL93DRAFT_450361 [Clavulina sp. PMI_390]|nr:hypothetical protein DL93DRAFT_450361 [Clavulina sp. PMI_390]